MSTGEELLDRYQHAPLGDFGRPQLVLDHGDGCWVWDVDGFAISISWAASPSTRSATTTLNWSARCRSRSRARSTSRTSSPVARRSISPGGFSRSPTRPTAPRVFFANPGPRRSRRRSNPRAAPAGPASSPWTAFHGRTTGALALTSRPAYREPFEPLLPGVRRVPYADLPPSTPPSPPTSVPSSPNPSRGGWRPRPGPDYLRAVRDLTAERGVLLILDEGADRDRAHRRLVRFPAERESGPTRSRLAKGLGGGVPIGALVTFGARDPGLLTPGLHGSTFGGNPLAAAAGLAVLDTLARDDLLAHARAVGDHLADAVRALDHPLIGEVRGRGLLRAIGLTRDIAVATAVYARDAGFPRQPGDAQRPAPRPTPILTAAEADLFVAALGGLLDRAASETS